MSWHQYAAAWAVAYGGYDIRRAPVVTRGWLWLGYGLARSLAAVRLRPVEVGLAGLALAGGVPLAARSPSAGLLVAAGLALLSAMAGTVARALGVIAGRTAARTAVREAVTDRLGEVAWLVGFWVAGVPGGLVALAAAGTGLQEYLREQALAAGMSRLGVQTVGQRPARVVVAVAGLALAGASPATPGLLIVATAAWLLLALAGLGQLAAAVRRTLP